MLHLISTKDNEEHKQSTLTCASVQSLKQVSNTTNYINCQPTSNRFCITSNTQLLNHKISYHKCNSNFLKLINTLIVLMKAQSNKNLIKNHEKKKGFLSWKRMNSVRDLAEFDWWEENIFFRLKTLKSVIFSSGFSPELSYATPGITHLFLFRSATVQPCRRSAYQEFATAEEPLLGHQRVDIQWTPR